MPRGYRSLIKEDLIPRAVAWFTGAAVQEDEDDDDYEDEEGDDEDEEDDDDDDDEVQGCPCCPGKR